MAAKSAAGASFSHRGAAQQPLSGKRPLYHFVTHKVRVFAVQFGKFNLRLISNGEHIIGLQRHQGWNKLFLQGNHDMAAEKCGLVVYAVMSTER